MKKSNLLSLIVSQLLFLSMLPLLLNLIHFLHPIVYFVIWMFETMIVYFFVYFIRKDTFTISKQTLLIGLTLYSICLLILLFMRPSNQTYDSYNLIPFETIAFYFSGTVHPLIACYNLTANVGLFIPFGTAALLLINKRSAFLLAIVPIIIISLIELLQFITQRGSLDIDDLILNVVGVFLGYSLIPIVGRVIKIY